MEVKNLMVGDLVKQKHSGLILKVSEIVPPYIRAEGEDGQFHGDTLEPISLTPEILEKNGWYYTKFDGSYGRKAMRTDGFHKDNLPEGVDNALSFAQWSIDEKFLYHMLEIYMWVGSIHLKIEFVHELQHAMRLGHIDKEIKINKEG